MFVYQKESRKKARNRRILLYVVAGFLFFSVLGVVAFLRLGTPFQVLAIIPTLDGEIPAYASSIVENAERELLKSTKAKVWGTRNFLSWPKSIALGDPIFSTFRVEEDRGAKTIYLRGESPVRYGIWCATNEENNRCVWFDNDGLVSGPAPDTEGALVLKVSENANRELSVGSPIIGNNGFATLSTLHSLFEKRKIPITSIIFLSNKRELHFIGNSFRIISSTAFSLPSTTVAFIDTLATSGKLEKSEYIDLTVEGRVYVK